MPIARRIISHFRRGRSPRPASEGTSNDTLQDTQVALPIVPSTSSEGIVGSSTTGTGADIPSNDNRTSASSTYKSATTNHNEHPHIPQPADMRLLSQSTTSARREPALQIDPGSLWDRAYDNIKRGEPKLLEAYEKVLSLYADSSGEVDTIEQNQTRQTQMEHILNKSVDKTKRFAKVETNVASAIDILFSVKNAVGSGLQAVPIAAVAWSGICVALEFLQNPLEERKANRDGIIEVTKKMKWYSSLSKLLLEEDMKNGGQFADLRVQLQERIVDLYEDFKRHHQARRLEWKLDEVTKAENILKTALGQHGVSQANSFLKLLATLHLSRAEGEIMQTLFFTDMTEEIEKLQDRKDRLLVNSYKWILDNKEFKDFTEWNDNNSNILWIKGDAGKGKTMLLIGIINELTARQETHFDNSHLSYFFCQSTNEKFNTATSILRGLIWMLLHQERSLIHYLSGYKDRGAALFESSTAFYSLKKILQDILDDTVLEKAYLVIDALDECKREEPGLKQLLKLISEISQKNHKVKWLVSSRNEMHIERVLGMNRGKSHLSLELNAESVTNAVKIYIQDKLKGLKETYKTRYAYREEPEVKESLQGVLDTVSMELYKKANGTFLWVALVFQQINETNCGADELLNLITKIPSSLYGMYEQMMERIIVHGNNSEKCKRVLLTVVNAYRPLNLSELLVLAEVPPLTDIIEIIKLCGILTIGEHDKTIYFVHQSAKDYLVGYKKSKVLLDMFPSGYEEGHQIIITQSLKYMRQNLRRNMHNLKYPDTLVFIGLIIFVRRKMHGETNIYDKSEIDTFLKEHFLHWLEALVLMKTISSTALAVDKLIELLKGISSESQLLPLLEDMHRFILFSMNSIENTPLRLYSSALLFSPTGSLTRQLFTHEMPDWIVTRPAVDAGWGPSITILYGHNGIIDSVAFSHDATRIISNSKNMIKLWDAKNGTCIQTFQGNEAQFVPNASSLDNTQIILGSYGKNIKIWDAKDGACIKTPEGHSDDICSIAISHDSTRVVSGSRDRTIKIWDIQEGICIRTLSGHKGSISQVAFSHNSSQIASASKDKTIKIWDSSNGSCIKTFEAREEDTELIVFDSCKLISTSLYGKIRIWDIENGIWKALEHSDALALSYDSTRIVSGYEDLPIKIWDTQDGTCIRTLSGHGNLIKSLAFSRDATRIVAGYEGGTIKIWNATDGACIQTLQNNSGGVFCVAFSYDGTRIISGSENGKAQIWSVDQNLPTQAHQVHKGEVRCIALSHDSKWAASGSYDKTTIKIRDTASGTCIRTLENEAAVYQLAFSHDDTRMISRSGETVRIWDVSSGVCMHTLRSPDNHSFDSAALSHDSMQVALVSVPTDYDHYSNRGEYYHGEFPIEIWDVNNNESRIQALKGHTRRIWPIVYSRDGKRLVSSYSDRTMKIWDLGSGVCAQTINVDSWCSSVNSLLR
ncbi:WD40-repeat-containing domain protein [Xylogone sp. PMI_703]|nr:WD40-repeat-containing domain protein [Xylogone sp. PMI_703]